MPRRREKRSEKTSASPTELAPVRRTPPGKRRPGRPPIHDEPWTKVTVVLFTRQIEFLDRLAATIRAQNGSAISRAQLIRALVDAVGEAEVDLTASRSEADLKAALLARLLSYPLP